MKVFFLLLIALGLFLRPAFAEAPQKYKNMFHEMTRQEPLGEAGLFITDSVSLYAWTWAWALAIQPDLRHAVAHASFDRWGDQISRAPVWNDGNDFVTNNIFHPLAGGFYYQYMRSMNHPRWLSAVETFLQSVLFEYTIEGQYTTPSAQDLLKTTGLGVPLGLLMDEFSRKLMQVGSKNKKIAGYVLNPLYLLPWARWPDSKRESTVGLSVMIEF